MPPRPRHLTPLAGGGQASVWKATLRGQPVVVKVARPAQRARVEREIAILTTLDHPHVVRILDHGIDDDGAPWFAMEAAATTLGSLSPPLGQERFETLARGLLGALAHAHAHGVLHLDLTPGNVLLDADGQPLLADFGAAAEAESAAAERFGTPAYMAPERFETGGDVGPWTDLYALGAVLWTARHGRKPVEADSWQSYAQAHHAGLDLPAGDRADAWLQRLMARRPAERFATAAEAGHALLGSLTPGRTHGRRGWLVRPGPLVGRDEELAQLERAFEACVATGEVRRLVLIGDAGCGKTHLARSFTRRLHEEGRAHVLRATHTPLGDRWSGLAGLVRRWFRAPDDREALTRRLSAALGRMGSLVPGHPGRVRQLLEGTGDSARRHGSMRELLRLVDGPVVFELDDVQWGRDTLSFVAALQEERRPVLVLATAQREALSERPSEARLLGSWDALPVHRLQGAAGTAMLDSLVALEPTLRARVAAHTAGHPLFARQLLAGWAASEALVDGPSGYTLRDGLWPADLKALWRARMADLLATDAAGLQLAAVFGSTVSETELAAACAHAGIPFPRRGIEGLVARGLAYRDPARADRFSFAHGLQRSALLDLAAQAGRRQALHRSCAAVATTAATRGHHLLLGHAPSPAADALLEALIEASRVGDVALSEEMEHALGRALAQLDAADPRQGMALCARALMRQSDGDREEKAQLLAQARAGARTHGWRFPLLPYLQAITDLTDGRVDDALEGFAEVVAETDPTEPLHTRARISVGMAQLRRGEATAARRHLLAALDGCRARHDALGLMRCGFGLANAAVQLGDLDAAERFTDLARSGAEEAGSARGLAECDTYFGEISRQQGDYRLAEHHLRQAAEALAAIDPEEAWVARVNLGSALLQQGRVTEARAELEAVWGWASENAELLAVAATAGMVACLADDPAQGPWEQWLDRMSQAVAAEYVEIDLAQLMDLAAERAAAADHPQRAAQATELAAALWARLR